MPEAMKDKRLPNFDFSAYPLQAEEEDEMGSPRIRDELWGQYEQQSEKESGCT